MLQGFNNSTDETAYFGMIFNRENVAKSEEMMQPLLTAYYFHSSHVPVLVDFGAIAADRTLRFASCFTIVVFRGSNIAPWWKAV